MSLSGFVDSFQCLVCKFQKTVCELWIIVIWETRGSKQQLETYQVQVYWQQQVKTGDGKSVKRGRKCEKGTQLDLRSGRRVDSRPSLRADDSTHCGGPKGLPRLTERRKRPVPTPTSVHSRVRASAETGDWPLRENKRTFYFMGLVWYSPAGNETGTAFGAIRFA